MNETPRQERPPQGEGVRTDNLRSYSALRRSVTDRKIAGVAGGLGRHLNVDPVIFRVLFVVLVFFGGAGLLLYVAAWVLVPEEETGDTVVSTSDGTRNALLIGAAVLAALLILGDSWGGWGFPWWIVPVAVIGGVVMLLNDRAQGRTPPVPPTVPPVPPPGTTAAGASYAPGSSFASAPPAYPEPAWGPPEPAWQPPVPPAPPAPPTTYPAGVPAAPPPPSRRDRGPLLFGFTLALVAVGLGVLGLFEATGTDVPDAAYPALALALTGTMLVVGSFFGRAGGLILLGLVAAVALAGSSIAEPRFSGDRAQEFAPTSAAAVRDSYHVPAGQIVLDLTDVRDPAELDGRSISLDANAGELVVVLPDDVAATVDASVDFGGAIDLPNRSEDGFDVDARSLVNGDDPVATVDLDLGLKFGHIEVRTS
jgi:phage shock protein PspC (stress-responsive transcriptional regulator)